MKAIFIYMLLFVIVFFSFFTEKKKKLKFNPIKGIIYSVDKSKKVIFSNQKEAEGRREKLSINMYSKVELPPNFDVKLLEEEKNVDYIILSKEKFKQLQIADDKIKNMKKQKKKKIKQVKKKKIIKKEQPVKQVKPIMPSTKEKRENKIVKNPDSKKKISVDMLREVLNTSDKKHYIMHKKQEIKDISFTIKSVTPYKNKKILEFIIDNKQGEYFFISDIKLYGNKKKLETKNYFKSIIPGNKKVTGYILFPHDSQGSHKIKLRESEGKGRNFNIKFNI